MSYDRMRFANPAACRAIPMEFVSAQIPGLWVPLAEVREGTGWPAESGNGRKTLISTVKAAARDGAIEFKSGSTSGRASVRLKVNAGTKVKP